MKEDKVILSESLADGDGVVGIFESATCRGILITLEDD